MYQWFTSTNYDQVRETLRSWLRSNRIKKSKLHGKGITDDYMKEATLITSVVSSKVLFLHFQTQHYEASDDHALLAVLFSCISLTGLMKLRN
ncbi:hypothetical protein SCA6_012977 [Theobroma cacao]